MTDEQHEGDLDRVSRQNSFTDTARGIEDRTQGGGFFNRLIHGALVASPVGRAIAERTDFDSLDLDLNAMIDLVEQTDPEDLESSGKALWDARDAIKEAADGLKGHLATIHWVGESGEALQKWGVSLVTNTHHLSEYAGSAGDQVTAAAVGLAAVRSAMPSRDARPSKKRPDQFTETEKAANKEEYAAAVAVEKDRQEAINQMNRLSSYYAVSEEVLTGLPAKQPEFKPVTDVAVPRPAKSLSPGAGADATATEGSVTAGATRPHESVGSTGDVRGHGTSDTPAPSQDVTGRVVRPDMPAGTSEVPVGTQIDSVGTLPQATTPPVTGSTPPITGNVPGGGQTGPFDGGGFGTSTSKGASGKGLSGTGAARTPVSAQGRAGAPGSANAGVGRSVGQGPVNQMGRATSTGQSGAKGVTPGSRSLPMGPGVTGGTPRAGGTAAPRASSGPTTGAGRANGVVGGRPTATGGSQAKDGARMSRGTIVGGEGAANSRPVTWRPGQRGVFGTSESTTRPGSSTPTPRAGTGAGGPGGVTGRPSARNSAARAERNGMTRGGAGLVRGPGRQGKSEGEEEAPETARPVYLVEDEETHLPNNPRRDVPPVVN